MESIKKWVEEKGVDIIIYNDGHTEFLILPFCAIFKNNAKYHISFDIEEDKSFCFDFFEDISTSFWEKIQFLIYYDCYFEVDESDKIEYILFGDDAKTAYWEFIKEISEEGIEIPKNITTH